MVSTLVSKHFVSRRLGHTTKASRMNFAVLIRDMLNFDFLEKVLGLVPPTYFVYDFSRKKFSRYILSTDQISLSDTLYVLGYWAIRVL